MGKIIEEHETAFDVGDVVIFKRNEIKGGLAVGIVEGYYYADDNIWYDIRISKDFVYTYTNGGDIGEYDIIGKVEEELAKECYSIITESEEC